MHDGRPNMLDAIKYKVPHLTTIAAAVGAARGIEAFLRGHDSVKSLQAYHADNWMAADHKIFNGAEGLHCE